MHGNRKLIPISSFLINLFSTKTDEKMYLSSKSRPNNWKKYRVGIVMCYVPYFSMTWKRRAHSLRRLVECALTFAERTSSRSLLTCSYLPDQVLCLGQRSEPTASPENETPPKELSSMLAGLPSARAQLYHWRQQGITLKIAFTAMWQVFLLSF